MVPKVAFDDLKQVGYNKIIFTSATLPKKSLVENLTGLKFQKHVAYT